VTVRDLPQSYGDAARFLNGKDKGKGQVNLATVANNTKVCRLIVHPDDSPGFGLLLHGHLIVQWRKNGRVVLDSCGYRSVTTKQRLNAAQKLVAVYQRDYQWYVVRRIHGNASLQWDKPEQFFDGIIFTDTDQAIAWHYDRTGDPNGPTGGYTGD
jgi:hypothetical protein